MARLPISSLQIFLDLAKPYFSNLQIEVMPLKAEEYKELTNHGLNGVICFQETYHKANYKTYHPRGMKSKFEWRVNGFDRMGQAGVHKIGMGVLIGLEEWRTDVTMMAYHLRYLQKHYWKTKYSVNFPRMRPAENGGFQPNVIMNDRELAQLTFAMRIFDHDVDISYSTREPAQIPNRQAVDIVEASSLNYTVLRPGYLREGAEDDFVLSVKGEPAKGYVTTIPSLVKLALQLMEEDTLYSRESVSITRNAVQEKK